MKLSSRKPNRDITVIIDAVISCLPSEGYSSVIIELERIKKNVFYTAPEIMVDRWLDLTLCLHHKLPNPDTSDAPEWARKIKRIMMGE